MSILVSVVVPTYRRPDLLERCLEALLAQDFDPASYEIIIADDAGSPETLLQVSGWAERAVSYTVWPANGVPGAGQMEDAGRAPQTRSRTHSKLVAVTGAPAVRYLAVQGEHGPAAARNAGWRAAEGEIIAFTDDDTVPEPGWLKAGVQGFSQGAVGVSGRVMMPLPEDPTDYERDAAGLERSDFVTASCFYLRSALEVTGGFDTQFKLAWREDTDLYFTLLEKGAKLAWAPDAIVLHPIRPAHWGISLKQQRKSMYNALLKKKHPALYRELVQSRPPIIYYLAILGWLTGIAGAIFGISQACAAGILLGLGATGWFFYKRIQATSKKVDHILEMAVTSLAIPWLSVYWRVRGAITFRTLFL